MIESRGHCTDLLLHLRPINGCGQQDVDSVFPKVRVKPRTRLFLSLCPHTTSQFLSVFYESCIHFEQIPKYLLIPLLILKIIFFL